jgi:hypothetical protein
VTPARQALPSSPPLWPPYAAHLWGGRHTRHGRGLRQQPVALHVKLQHIRGSHRPLQQRGATLQPPARLRLARALAPGEQLRCSCQARQRAWAGRQRLRQHCLRHAGLLLLLRLGLSLQLRLLLRLRLCLCLRLRLLLLLLCLQLRLGLRLQLLHLLMQRHALHAHALLQPEGSRHGVGKGRPRLACACQAGQRVRARHVGHARPRAPSRQAQPRHLLLQQHGSGRALA